MDMYASPKFNFLNNNYIRPDATLQSQGKAPDVATNNWTSKAAIAQEATPGMRIDYGTKTASNVLVIVTGGTIAMKNKDGVYVPESNYISKVIECTPVLNDREYFSLPTTTFPRKDAMPGADIFVLPKLSASENRVLYHMFEYESLLDSSNMTVEDYKKIANDVRRYYEKFDGFVILHGTDTMAYTASYLSFMFENLGKPVILTGAQMPLCAARSDGVDNLLGALLIAGNYNIPEVSLFFHHRLYRGNRVVKVDSQSFHAFDSPNADPIVVMGVDVKVNWELVWRSEVLKAFQLHTDMEENVGLLRLFPGITASTVRGFLNPPIKGIALQTYGAGNGPSNRKDILAALRDAADRGVLIVNCTQCYHGGVTPSYETGKAMEDAGIISGHDITPEAALAKLSYILGKEDIPHKERHRYLTKNLRGEISKREIFSGNDKNQFFEAIAESMRLYSGHERNNLRSALYPPWLCFAAKHGDTETLEKLRLQGADLCSADYDGRTALHVASSEGQVDVVRYLLHRGATVYARDRFGHTPLEDAINFRRIDCIELLRQAGAHLAISPKSLGSILCRLAHEEDVQGLLAWAKGGANMSATDHDSRSALIIATTNHSVEIRRLLLEHGADPRALNHIEPRAFAESSGDPDMNVSKERQQIHL